MLFFFFCQTTNLSTQLYTQMISLYSKQIIGFLILISLKCVLSFNDISQQQCLTNLSIGLILTVNLYSILKDRLIFKITFRMGGSPAWHHLLFMIIKMWLLKHMPRASMGKLFIKFFILNTSPHTFFHLQPHPLSLSLSDIC